MREHIGGNPEGMGLVPRTLPELTGSKAVFKRYEHAVRPREDWVRAYKTPQANVKGVELRIRVWIEVDCSGVREIRKAWPTIQAASTLTRRNPAGSKSEFVVSERSRSAFAHNPGPHTKVWTRSSGARYLLRYFSRDLLEGRGFGQPRKRGLVGYQKRADSRTAKVSQDTPDVAGNERSVLYPNLRTNGSEWSRPEFEVMEHGVVRGINESNSTGGIRFERTRTSCGVRPASAVEYLERKSEQGRGCPRRMAPGVRQEAEKSAGVSAVQSCMGTSGRDSHVAQICAQHTNVTFQHRSLVKASEPTSDPGNQKGEQWYAIPCLSQPIWSVCGGQSATGKAERASYSL